MRPPRAVALRAQPAAESATQSSGPDDVLDVGATLTLKLEEEAQEQTRVLALEEFLKAIARVDRGFAASSDDREAIKEQIQKLATLNPSRAPAYEIGGRWTLLYTDAPDILGIPRTGGPFVELARIGQEIDSTAGTIANVIEWRPPKVLSGLASFLDSDRLIQRVFTEFTVASPSRVELNIKGLGFQPTRSFGVDLPAVAKLEAKGPLSLPFGAFEVLYSDGEYRIVRTGQGYYSVNRREGDFP